MRRSIAALATLAALVVPAAALAAQPGPPPGNSGADQYTENIPTAGGSQTTGGGGGAGGGGGGSAVSPGTVRELQGQGSAGKGAAAFAQATAPRGAHRGEAASEGGGGTPIGDVLKQVTGADSDSGGGMGLVLPIVLGASLLAAVGLLLARRRGGRTGQA
jgi:hypothetical protein